MAHYIYRPCMHVAFSSKLCCSAVIDKHMAIQACSLINSTEFHGQLYYSLK